MEQTQAPDPINHPTIELAGKTYPVRLELADVIALEKQGVDILRRMNFDEPLSDGSYPSVVERSMKILAQGTHAGLGANRITELVGFERLAEAIQTATEAVKKVAERIAPAAPATSQPEPDAPLPN